MPFSALALALAAAVVAGVVVGAPFAALTWRVETDAWPYIAASAALELAYFTLLAAAYRRAELSFVYPLARGVAPVLVLVVAVAVLGASTSAAQIAGIVLVAAGVLLVRGPSGDARAADLALALAVAAAIAGYTLVDNEGIRYASAFAYLVLVLVPTAIVLPVGVAAVRGRRALLAQIRPATLAVGAGMVGAYALVLLALRLAPAAPVAAVRETSIVIGVALAVPLLHERVGRRRLAGAAIVAAGVGLIALS